MQVRCNVGLVGSVCEKLKERASWEELDGLGTVGNGDNSKNMRIVVLSTVE